MNQEPSATDHLALSRTKLALERTFLAYLRTFLGFLASGIGLVLIEEFEHVQEIGYGFIAVSVVILVFGIVRYFRERKQVRQILE